MRMEDVEAELWREPFMPLRIHLSDGRKFDIPFRDSARMLTYGFLVFIGMKEGTHRAKGFDRFPYDEIIRIEQRPAKGRRARKKAS